jgi:hypothetical protein
MAGSDMSEDELGQADLSHLRLSEMNKAQKEEMRRRYFDFVRRLAKPSKAAPPPTPRATAKWEPRKVTKP